MLERFLDERKALSLLGLGFFTTVFTLGALNMEGGWRRCFLALALVYGTAFFGLAAEWFWGRWFAMGVGVSGMTMAVLGFFSLGMEPGLMIWGGLHLLVYLPLAGDAMAARIEGRPEWRQRYNLDEHGVQRLKRAIGSAATGLPTLILFTLAPRQGQGVQLLMLALAGLGCYGLLRLRVWGVALIGLGALVGVLLSLAPTLCPLGLGHELTPLLQGLGILATVFLLVSVSPLVVPAWRFLTMPADRL